MLAWDTETCLIRPGSQAPPLAVLSWAQGDQAGLVSWQDAEKFARKRLLVEPTITANAPFDYGVLGSQYPKLINDIFDVFDNDQVFDIITRQKLADIARGRYRMHGNYNLSNIHERLVGTPLEKDEWRLRYAEFRDLPLDQWPAGARQYALDDARAHLACFNKQEEKYEKGIFEDLHRQCRADWALHLMSVWGMRTDLEAVQKLDKKLGEMWVEARDYLRALDIVREDGSKDTKAAKLIMFEVMGDLCKLTKTGVKNAAKLVKKGATETEAHAQMVRENHHKFVSTDRESCEACGDERMLQYCNYVSIDKLRGTYVTKLWAGATHPDGTARPIHPNFEVLLETGRTSCSAPNVQNPPRAEGVRECFIPRKGWVYINCDFDLAELRSLAQVCLSRFGYSKLANALNAGYDPHLSVAAQIMGIPYDEAKTRRKAGDKLVKEMRTLAKAANFGFPGGLGPATFIAFARGTYKVILTLEQAAKLRKDWRAAWPEIVEYHRWIGGLVEEFDGIQQYTSGRRRGNVTFTQCSNSFFQGLTADAAKETLWEICKRQFTVRSSALFGTRNVNFVHDEYLVEAREAQAHDAAMELAQVMRDVYSRWTPDVPMGPTTCTPVLMRRWSKAAGETPIYDANGRLIPWEDRPGAVTTFQDGAVHTLH